MNASVTKGAFAVKGKSSKICIDDYIEEEAEACDQQTVNIGLNLMDSVSDSFDHLQAEFNEQLFGDLAKFVHSTHRNFTPSASFGSSRNGSEEDEMEVDENTCNRVHRTGLRNEIPAAALLLGVNSPDHKVLFYTLSSQLNDNVTPHIASLHSRDCTTLRKLMTKLLQQIMQRADVAGDEEDGYIEQDDTELNMNKVSCTMSVLSTWYHSMYPSRRQDKEGPSPSKKRKISGDPASPQALLSPSCSRLSQYPPIVIIIEDLEAFRPAVLQDFITICSTSLLQLPLVLILGIATSMAAVHKVIPYRVSSLMCMEKFQVAPAVNYLAVVIEKLLLHPESSSAMKLGPKVFNFLLDLFLYHDFSAVNFIAAYKYCLLQHFSAHPHSMLCVPNTEAMRDLQLLNTQQLDHIRSVRSFRRYVEKQKPQEQIDLLTNDNHAKAVISSLLQCYFSHQQTFYPALQCLHTLVHQLPKYPLGRQIRELYAECLSSFVCDTSDYELCFSLLGNLSIDTLLAHLVKCIEILSSSGVSAVAKYTDKLSELVTKFTFIDDQPDPNEEDEEPAMLTRNATQPKKLTMYDLKLQLQSRDKRKKPTVYETLRKEALKQLDDMFREYLISPQSLPLHEIYYYDNIEEIRSRINPTPRSTIQQALAQPALYIDHPGCECDVTSILPTLPDLCIVYKLHCECGRLINLFDWLQAFAHMTQLADTKRKSRNKANKVDQIVQARFSAAVAELQILGFIKGTKRKTDHVARLTW